MRSMPVAKSSESSSVSFSRVALYSGYVSLRKLIPLSFTQARYSGRWVATRRLRKLTTPHAALVFSPRLVRSGR